jgi:hypothetical protein
MLEAHLSPPYVNKLRLQLLEQASVDDVALRNLWLLSPSVHKAFREGHVAVRLTSRPLENSEFAMRELDEDNLDARVSTTVITKTRPLIEHSLCSTR